jgi:LAO/AO transport system kinase
MHIIDKILEGDILALSRIIKKIENEDEEIDPIITGLQPALGKAIKIGITGPAGVGKSSLVDKLICEIRKSNLSIGVIAVDPTSPFTGGAVLGDRIRMQQHFNDPGVYIRSMGSRGGRGGLPRTAGAVIKVLDAFGKDIILIETVGVGQTEIEITKMADTVVVILSPECGDEVQTIKAGILEIADVFAINKADRPGADDLVNCIDSMIKQNKKDRWSIPIVETIAVENKGIHTLYEHIANHVEYLKITGEINVRRKKQLRNEFIANVTHHFVYSLIDAIEKNAELNNYIALVERGDISPYTAARKLIIQLKKAYLEYVYQNK